MTANHKACRNPGCALLNVSVKVNTDKCVICHHDLMPDLPGLIDDLLGDVNDILGKHR